MAYLEKGKIALLRKQGEINMWMKKLIDTLEKIEEMEHYPL